MKKNLTFMCAAVVMLMMTGCDKLLEDLESIGNSNSAALNTVPESLVAYYDFNNETGDDATDNGYDGTLNGSPSFVSETANGKGKALQLQASKGQKFVIPYKLLGDDDYDYSVCFWIKDFSNGMIFVESISNNSYGRGFYSDNECFAATLGYNYSVFDYEPQRLMNSGWHHIAVVHAAAEGYGNGYHSIYVDGRKVDEQSVSYWYAHNSGKIVFGESNGNAGGASFKIDNIRFYNRVLDADEVESIYYAEK